MENRMKKIALINDLSGFGKCSLTASIPVISAMGIQACPLPTAVLTSQTGFSDYYCDDYTDRMDYFTQEWQKLDVSFDGIYSGYLASAEQVTKVLHFLDVFQTDNIIYLADPVLGDNGQQIKSFSPQLLAGMQNLCARATVCTPNLTELCLLTDSDYNALTAHADSCDYMQYIQEIAQKLLYQNSIQNHIQNNSRSVPDKPAAQTILITGILCHKGGQPFMGNLAVTANDDRTYYYETPYTGQSFSGTGDLFASVLCGSLVQGLSISDAVQRAVDFLLPAIEEATAEKLPRNHGIPFEKYLYQLIPSITA